MNKSIETFSSLVARANRLRESDVNAYSRLRCTHTDTLLHRARVHFDVTRCKFILSSPTQCDGEVVVTGHLRDGEWLTSYELKVTATKYPRQVVETYTPFYFPSGKPVGYATRRDMPVVALDKSGQRRELTWNAPRRRGRMGTAPLVVLEDDSGQWADNRPLSGWTNGEFALPHLPMASTSVSDWLASIDQVPLANHATMKDLASRSLQVAARLCKKDPRMKVRVFPAMPWNNLSPQRWNYDSPICFSRENWRLPEVVLFWHDWTDENGCPHYTSIVFQIPPHGRPDMDYTKGSSPSYQATWHDGCEAHQYLWAKAPGASWSEWRNRMVCYDKPWSSVTSQERLLCKPYANWATLTDCVRVIRHCPQRTTPKILLKGEPAAMRPEDLELQIEEASLMSSLPLC